MSTSEKRQKENVDPAEALELLRSALIYVMQSGFVVKTGMVKDGSYSIRVYGAEEVANSEDGISIVPSEQFLANLVGVPSGQRTGISENSKKVPSVVPSAPRDTPMSQNVPNFSLETGGA